MSGASGQGISYDIKPGRSLLAQAYLLSLRPRKIGVSVRETSFRYDSKNISHATITRTGILRRRLSVSGPSGDTRTKLESITGGF